MPNTKITYKCYLFGALTLLAFALLTTHGDLSKFDITGVTNYILAEMQVSPLFMAFCIVAFVGLICAFIGFTLPPAKIIAYVLLGIVCCAMVATTALYWWEQFVSTSDITVKFIYGGAFAVGLYFSITSMLDSFADNPALATGAVFCAQFISIAAAFIIVLFIALLVFAFLCPIRRQII